jgi:hypothetical protein
MDMLPATWDMRRATLSIDGDGLLSPPLVLSDRKASLDLLRLS